MFMYTRQTSGKYEVCLRGQLITLQSAQTHNSASVEMRRKTIFQNVDSDSGFKVSLAGGKNLHEKQNV